MAQTDTIYIVISYDYSPASPGTVAVHDVFDSEERAQAYAIDALGPGTPTKVLERPLNPGPA